MKACLVLAAACAVARAGDDAQERLARALELAQSRPDSVSRRTCSAVITRTACARAEPGRPHCAPCPGNPRHVLDHAGRITLEVSLFQDGEMFSWPGDQRFRTADLSTLVGGGVTAVGEFATFAIAALSKDAAPGGIVFRDGAYILDVTAARSHFGISGNDRVTHFTPYRAKLWLDPAGQLQRLEVDVDAPPPETGIAAAHVRTEFRELIPAKSRTTVEWPNGSVAVNETEYPECRTFGAESRLVAESAAPVAEPEATAEPPLRLAPAAVQVALVTPVDSMTAAVGQRIEGRLLKALRTPDRRVAVPVNSRVVGRVMRFEHYPCPTSRFVVGFEFDEVVLGNRHVPIHLEPNLDRAIYPVRQRPALSQLLGETRPGVQNFDFTGPMHLRLGKNFVSKWRVVE